MRLPIPAWAGGLVAVMALALLPAPAGAQTASPAFGAKTAPAASSATPAASSAAGAEDSPPLELPESELAKGLKCREGLASSDKTPVLFLPGTGLKGEENFAWNYMAELNKRGHRSCWVNVPGRGLRDLQETAEYVVYAARQVHERTGRKIALVGHSQGGFMAGWALRFWPDLASKVDDVVTLGSRPDGTVLASPCRPIGAVLGCPPAVFQVANDSNWTKALRANGKPMPAGPSYSMIYSMGDESVIAGGRPPTLAGTTSVGVQDVCPDRTWPNHIGLAVDLVTYELAVDALDHPGPADPRRIDPADCATKLMPISIDELVKALPGMLDYPMEMLIHSQPWAHEEPPLRPYARGAAA